MDVRHAPAALPPLKTRYPLYRRLGESQSRAGRLRNISPQRNSIPGPSIPYRLAMPTELSRPTHTKPPPRNPSVDGSKEFSLQKCELCRATGRRGAARPGAMCCWSTRRCLVRVSGYSEFMCKDGACIGWKQTSSKSDRGGS